MNRLSTFFVFVLSFSLRAGEPSRDLSSFDPVLLLERIICPDTSVSDLLAGVHAIKAQGKKVLPVLRSGLDSSDAKRKRLSVELIGHLGEGEDAARLHPLLSGENIFFTPLVRRSLKQIYSRFDSPVPDISSSPWSEQVLSAWLSAQSFRTGPLSQESKFQNRFHTDSVLALAVELLKSKDWVSRFAACEVLAGALPPGKDQVSLLIQQVISDPVPAVKIAAIQSLSCYSKVDIKDIVDLRQRFADPSVQLELTRLLLLRGEEGMLDEVNSFLENAQYRVRLRAAEIVLERASPFSEEALSRLLAGTVNNESSKGLFSVGQNSDDRILAAKALGSLQGQGISASLHRALDDKEPGVRVAAAVALMQQGGVGLHWRFMANTVDPNPEVRRHACRALGLLGQQGVWGKLMEMSHDMDSDVASTALVALLTVNQDREALINRLKECVHSDNLPVAIIAVEGLACLERSSFFAQPPSKVTSWRARLEAQSIWPSQ